MPSIKKIVKWWKQRNVNIKNYYFLAHPQGVKEKGML